MQEMQALAADLAALQAQHEQHSVAAKREAEALLGSRWAARSCPSDPEWTQSLSHTSCREMLCKNVQIKQLAM